MSAYRFTLIVEGPDLQTDAASESLHRAGCDDALVGSTDGIQFLDFARVAPDSETAILSAIADAERVPGVAVIRLAGGGLVSLSDIAARSGRSRSSMRQLIENVFANPS